MANYEAAPRTSHVCAFGSPVRAGKKCTAPTTPPLETRTCVLFSLRRAPHHPICHCPEVESWLFPAPVGLITEFKTKANKIIESPAGMAMATLHWALPDRSGIFDGFRSLTSRGSRHDIKYGKGSSLKSATAGPLATQWSTDTGSLASSCPGWCENGGGRRRTHLVVEERDCESELTPDTV